MVHIRYGARSGNDAANEGAAPDNPAEPVWVDALESVYETDPSFIAAVLPPPLVPGPEPLVRLTIAAGVDTEGTPLDHLWFGVQAQFDGTVGDYALLVGVSADHELIEGREVLGEPRKLVEVTCLMNGSRIQHRAERRGHVVARIVGTVESHADPRTVQRTEFAFRGLPAEGHEVAGAQVELMQLRRTIVERRAVTVVGATRLGVSPYDPVGDLKVRHTRSITLSQRTTEVVGHRVATVPHADVEPFIHQRYDQFETTTTPLTRS